MNARVIMWAAVAIFDVLGLALILGIATAAVWTPGAQMNHYDTLIGRLHYTWWVLVLIPGFCLNAAALFADTYLKDRS